MSAPRVESIACTSPSGIHRMAYYEWGDPQNRDILLCVHGLTRNGRDFDMLAERLSRRFRVVCPDIVGRGLSDWLPNPAGYQVPQYASDIVTLLGRLRPATLNWVGTSMGGLIAMVYCGLVAKAINGRAPTPPARLSATIDEPIMPITRLVLNDVGPRVEPQSLLRIGAYLMQTEEFDSYQSAMAYLRDASASFGLKTDEQWDMFARHYFARRNDKWIKHYDPSIAGGFTGMTPEAMQKGEQYLWGVFDAIKAPTLILHGTESDLLSADSVRRMLSGNSNARCAEIEGVGHAPSLMVPGEIDVIESFLAAN